MVDVCNSGKSESVNEALPHHTTTKAMICEVDKDTISVRVHLIKFTDQVPFSKSILSLL